MEHTLVKVPYNGHAVFFRVTAVDAQSNAVSVRLERFTLFWQQTDILIQPGACLRRRCMRASLFERMFFPPKWRCADFLSPERQHDLSVASHSRRMHAVTLCGAESAATRRMCLLPTLCSI